ncbi:thiol:disulfide interchange protein DsbA/DsbL [Crenobacter cavernae]|uniref:Thiol:disulfide interchange protein n=1 Tax=Crenobacter cavernae TaxID=2290923 RepID=A0A345Y3A3_9NEIS|nr:thiol:disulfide interchange protein DsbA/DsbL [Crenobacter cavernae]AXK38405.1 thiol:disulfide interchange protein DsbA/DsbL [Crenobacter cavernae]
MKKLALVALLCATSFAQAAITLGKDYTVLAKPQPVANPKKVEVIEFFSYTCIHCYHLEPTLSAWEKKRPADVDFRREQIVWGQSMEGFARLYSTLNVSGLLGKLHQPAFEAVLKQKTNLGDEAVLSGWIKQQAGADAGKFMQTYKSFGINAQVKRASKMTRDYAIEGTPTIVVAGKYATLPAEPARLMQVVDELVAKARQERKK